MAGARLSHRRNFSERQPVNRRALLAKSPLEFCRRQRRVFDLDLAKTRIAGSDSLDLLEVITLISRDVKRSVGDERALNRIEKIRRDEATAMMATFWPGIGKEQVECFNGFFGQQITNSVGNLYVQNANVFERECFSARFRNSADQFVDSEKVFFRATLRELAQKRAVATSKIDMKRRNSPEDRRKINGRDVRLRDQFDHRIG